MAEIILASCISIRHLRRGGFSLTVDSVYGPVHYCGATLDGLFRRVGRELNMDPFLWQNSFPDGLTENDIDSLKKRLRSFFPNRRKPRGLRRGSVVERVFP
jgi:hypothetical protein